MTPAKVLMFLRERDRAYARQDLGVIRSMNFELQRLGVSDTATFQHPDGRVPRNGNGKSREAKEVKRHPKPRCEHGGVPERCDICREAEIAEALEGV